MFYRYLIIYSLAFVLGGCIYNDEPMPQITYENNSKVIVPAPVRVRKKPITIDENIPRDWVAYRGMERKWTAIIIHHSGTRNGNEAIFDKWHKEKNHWEGVGYDFVIGNGTDSGDGEVEVTYRWHNQQTGAHCGGTAGNWANKYGIGICLVGNFDKTHPTSRQIKSLTKLVRFLQNRYGISKSRIYTHKTTPGARVTDCPGKRFFIADLR